jgi:CheY-like chemotaxis protein
MAEDKLSPEAKAALNILVVDDVPSARKVTVRMLSKLGFTNFIECDGVQDAIVRLKEDPIDLLIADIHLKDGLGTDLLKLLEGTDRLQTLRTLFVTSDMQKREFLSSLHCRATSFLMKPYSVNALDEKVESLWSN